MEKGRFGFGLAVVAMASVATAARADIRLTEKIRTADGEVRREVLLKVDRRRIETEPAGPERGAGERARPGATIDITRLDKETIWRLDPATKHYEALPLQRARDTGRSDAGET